MATKHPTLYTKQQCASIEIICVCVWSHHQSYLTDPVWGGKGIDSFQKTQLLYSPGGRHGNDVTHWNTWRDLKTSAPCSPPRHNSLRLGVLAGWEPSRRSKRDTSLCAFGFIRPCDPSLFNSSTNLSRACKEAAEISVPIFNPWNMPSFLILERGQVFPCECTLGACVGEEIKGFLVRCETVFLKRGLKLRKKKLTIDTFEVSLITMLDASQLHNQISGTNVN